MQLGWAAGVLVFGRAGGGGLLGVASVAAAHGSLALAALSFLLLSPLPLLELAAS